MEQLQGAQEQGQLDRTREGLDARTAIFRQMTEATVRLHGVLDSGQLVSTIAEVLRQVIGPAPGVLVLKVEGEDVRHPLGREAETLAAHQVNVATAKAMEALQAVVDGQGPTRAVALPLLAGTRLVGALYLGVADLERRLGTSWLEAVTLLGKHVAVAVDNGVHLRDLGTVNGSAAEDAIPPGLSLSESKKAFERKLIRARLRDARGNIAAAARSLDMDRGQLSRLLKKYGIDKGQYRAGPGKPK